MQIISLIGHSDRVNDLVFSKTGRYIVSASDDKTIKVWGPFEFNENLGILNPQPDEQEDARADIEEAASSMEMRQ